MVATLSHALNERIVQLSEITLPAPAKINLFLHIVGRRQDGYHELQTLFQLLDYGDELKLTNTREGGIQLTCNDPELANADNLIVKAAHALEIETNRKFNVSIHLDKKLPMGGGIGGGSSDCASALLGLNLLLNLQLTEQKLLNIAASLGADVPVFIKGQTAWAEGIGEKLTPIDLDEQWYIVIHPNEHISTPKLFSHPQLTRDTPASTIRPALAQTGHNDFEPLVRTLYPTVEKAFMDCAPYGTARLTGTGSCLFLKMQNEMTAQHALNSIKTDNPDLSAFIAKGVNVSPAKNKLKQYRVL